MQLKGENSRMRGAMQHLNLGSTNTCQVTSIIIASRQMSVPMETEDILYFIVSHPV